MSASKFFIVARDRPDVLASLQRAIGHEPGIEIFYDRRTSAHALAPERVDRRLRPDVVAEIEERGFAVVTLQSIQAPPRVRRFHG